MNARLTLQSSPRDNPHSRPHPLCPQCVAGLGPDHAGAHGRLTGPGLLTQQVPRLPSTHPGPICQLASCSTEPWQQGTASLARLHYACQMGWELDSNSHHGGREWRGIEEGGRERGGRGERGGGRKCVGGGGESNGFCFHLCCKLLHFNVTPLGPGSIKCLFLNNRH